MKIIKRNGSEAEFDWTKIVNAIKKANKEVEGSDKLGNHSIEEISHNVERICNTMSHSPSVEDIQNLVETEIMQHNAYALAKAYITYRFRHELIRKSNTTDEQILSLINLENEEVKQENSNKNPTVNSVQRDYMAGEVSKDISKRILLPEEIINAHEAGILHFHDMDYYAQHMHNCCLINLDDMLQNGTVISETLIEKPHSFDTACNIATQAIAQVASSQYGGQSISLAHISKFVDVSRKKLIREVTEELEGLNYIKLVDYNEDVFNMRLQNIVNKRLKAEITRGIQKIQYQVLTLMTTNGQTPFITVNLYLNEAEDEQQKEDLAMCIEEMLNQRIQGVKNEQGVWITPAFPKLIYVLQEDNIHEGDKYYYLTELAAKCTAKRMVPDYVSEKIMMSYKVDKNGKGHCYPPMGCVEGNELVTYKVNDNLFVESFSKMWRRLSKIFLPMQQTPGSSHLFINLKNVSIFDTKENKFVNTKRIIRNDNASFMRVTFSNGRVIDCTPDHPFDTNNRGRVYAKDLIVDEDNVLLNKTQYSDESIFYKNTDSAWMLGFLLCDGCYATTTSASIAEKGEDDIAEKLINVFKNEYGIKGKVKVHHRGIKGNYKEVYFPKSGDISHELDCMFDGIQKKYRHIPTDVFSWDRESKISFIAGMIDADGYINGNENTNTTFPVIQIGSTNKELSLQQMALLQAVGCPSRVYTNHYNSKKPSKIRYRVEAIATSEIVNALVCKKKKLHFNEDTLKNERSLYTETTGYVKSIEILDKVDYSYDVTTDSDHFEVSGIYSHNCRSFLTPYIDENGKPKYYGRFNAGVVTINLPDVALSANREFNADKYENPEEVFWDIFDERLELCHTALQYRHKRLRGTIADVSPIHWRYGALARLDKGETIDKLLFGGYSTLSLGFAGLYECVKAMTGYSHTDENAKGFALAIMQHMNDKCNEWKKEENIDYSLYGTPLESTTYKFAKCLQNRFGIIEGITDKNYITNSYHVVVTEKIDAFTKLKFESEFQHLSPGGAISYVEVPNMQDNIPAVLSVIKYIYENIMYAELNTKSDYCQECGYTGEIQIVTDDDDKLVWECPNCGNRDQNKMNVARRTCGLTRVSNSPR